MDLAVGIREPLRGTFTGLATEGALGFEGTVEVQKNRWASLEGEVLLIPDGWRPTNPMPGGATLRCRFEGRLRDNSVLHLDDVRVPVSLLPIADRVPVAVRSPRLRVVHPCQVQLGIGTTATVSIRWLLSPSALISSSALAINRPGRQFCDQLGEERLKRIRDSATPFRWTRPEGWTMELGIERRPVRELTGPGEYGTQGFATSHEYYCPYASFEASDVEGTQIERVRQDADSWLNHLLASLSLLEAHWVNWRERKLHVYSKDGTAQNDFETVATAEPKRGVPRSLPFVWNDPELPLRVLGALADQSRENHESFDPILEGWVMGSRAQTIPTMLAHLFMAIEALNSRFRSISPKSGRLLEKGLRSQVLTTVRSAAKTLLSGLGVEEARIELVTSRLDYHNQEPLDRSLQRLVHEHDIEVADLWPEPDSASQRRFPFVRLRNTLMHGRSLSMTEQEELYQEVQRLKEFIPRVMTELWGIDGLVNVIAAVRDHS